MSKGEKKIICTIEIIYLYVPSFDYKVKSNINNYLLASDMLLLSQLLVLPTRT